MSKDDKEDRISQLRNTRMNINSLKDELAERAEEDDEDEKDNPEATEGHTNSKYDSPIEEEEAASYSEGEHALVIDYEFPNDKTDVKAKPADLTEEDKQVIASEENVEKLQHRGADNIPIITSRVNRDKEEDYTKVIKEIKRREPKAEVYEKESAKSH